MANMHPQANSEPEHSSAARSEELTQAPLLNDLISAAFALRSQQRYALHPVEPTLRHLRAEAETNGTESGGQFDFEQAESVYRRGAQGLRLSQIPKLPEKISELSRLGNVDRAGRKAVRYWAEANDLVIPEGYFFERWATQGRLGGAEHQVFHDEESGRWFNPDFSYRFVARRGEEPCPQGADRISRRAV